MPMTKRSVFAVSATAAGALLISAPVAANAAPPATSVASISSVATVAEDRAAKTLVIGLDGASFDFLAPADMPNLDALRAEGMTAASNLYAAPMAGTVSGPGWSTIATGVWPDKHRVTDNNFSNPTTPRTPTTSPASRRPTPRSRRTSSAPGAPSRRPIFGPAKVDARVAGGQR